MMPAILESLCSLPSSRLKSMPNNLFFHLLIAVLLSLCSTSPFAMSGIAFFDNETEVQFEILEENAWEPFEDYRGKDIYQYISQLAYEIQNKLYPMEND